MKYVLITGGSRGIGLETVKYLKSLNYKMITPTRKELDLNNLISVKNYIKSNRGLKLYALINNAGVNKPQWIGKIEDENLSETINVNLISPILLCKGFISNLKKSKQAHIINLSSMFGTISRSKQSLYSSSKFGLVGLTKALAIELAEHNVLVNCISPGFVETDLTLRNSVNKNSVLANEIPLKRFAKPLEIAKLIAFLISTDNTYITGENIVIDGGYSIK
jgi:3-oxoacyl-[acyl-carrier protein] reductase